MNEPLIVLCTGLHDCHKWVLHDTPITETTIAQFVYATSRATYNFPSAGGQKWEVNGVDVEIPAFPLMLMTNLVYEGCPLENQSQEFISVVCHALHNLELEDVKARLGGKFIEAPIYDLSFRAAATLAWPTCECKLCRAVIEIKKANPPKLLGPYGEAPLDDVLDGCLIQAMHRLAWNTTYRHMANAVYTSWAYKSGKAGHGGGMPPHTIM